MIRSLTVAWLLCLSLVAGAVDAAERQGTKWETFAERELAAPADISVAVFAFPVDPLLWTQRTMDARTLAEVPRVAIALNLKRHGFAILPETESLVSLAQATDEAVEEAPPSPARRPPSAERARAMGEKLGADWVIYGEYSFNTDYDVRSKVLSASLVKFVRVMLHIVVLETESGDVIYWSRIEDSTRGSSTKHGMDVNAEDLRFARELILKSTNTIFDDIARALPEHRAGKAVILEHVDELLGQMPL